MPLNLSKFPTTLPMLPAAEGSIAVPNPLSYDANNSSIYMAPEEWRATYDKSFQAASPYTAALNSYYNPTQSNRTMGYTLGNSLNNFRKTWGGRAGSILDKGPLIGGLASAAPGLLLGGLGTAAVNTVTGNDTGHNVMRNALIAALLTGGLGAFSGYMRKYKPISAQTPDTQGYKSAAYGEAYTPGAPASYVVSSAIQAAPGMSFNERSKLMAGVAQLDANSLQQLAQALSTASGAAIGAIVSRFLLNKGLIGTVLGAIFGGAVAKAVFGTPNNALGQQSMRGKTFSGKNI